MTLSGLRAFGAGFLIFTDYARGAIRLSSLMDLSVIHVWTHDSISVGEDGPTHQPIEQLLSLRAIPGMVVIRPADANETTEAWRVRDAAQAPAGGASSAPASRCQSSIEANSPRPRCWRRAPMSSRTLRTAEPSVILIASGSEVSLCMAARETLTAEGIAVRVVSMPSWELFEDQDAGLSRQRTAAQRSRRG